MTIQLLQTILTVAGAGIAGLLAALVTTRVQMRTQVTAERNETNRAIADQQRQNLEEATRLREEVRKEAARLREERDEKAAQIERDGVVAKAERDKLTAEVSILQRLQQDVADVEARYQVILKRMEEQYAAQKGEYEQQISTLRQEIERLQKRVAELENGHALK